MKRNDTYGGFMKIEKETTVICGNKKVNAMRTNIPSIYRDIMGLKTGDKLLWTMTNENELKITKNNN